MFFRYLFVFVVFFMIANVVRTQEVPEPAQDEEQTDPRGFISGTLVKNALKILGKQFTGVAAHCLKEAADNCKKQLFPPKRLIRCARDYFKENQASCVVDEIMN